MNFTVTKENGEIIVTVNLPKLKKDPVTRRDSNRTILRQEHVMNFLREQKISVGGCIQKNDLDNMGDNLTAIWKFKAPQKKLDTKTSVVVSSRGAKRTKKSLKPKDE
jgi:hypothetical protein